eukprot:gene1921-5010_t
MAKKSAKRQAKSTRLLSRVTRQHIKSAPLRKQALTSKLKSSETKPARQRHASNKKNLAKSLGSCLKGMEIDADDEQTFSSSVSKIAQKPTSTNKNSSKSHKRKKSLPNGIRIPKTGVTSTQRIVHRKARQVTLATEMASMQSVLRSPAFQSNPVEAIQQHIMQNVSVLKAVQRV